MSHPTRGAWIEIHQAIVAPVLSMSHPTRGAWIEIILNIEISDEHRRVARRHRRTPPGVRGLKLQATHIVEPMQSRRTPPGVRGLKFEIDTALGGAMSVAPHPGCVD